MKKIISMALMAALCVSAYAQRHRDPLPQEYAYGSSLELQGGYSASMYSTPGEVKTARSFASGGDFNIRYTYFPGRHWGFFLSAGINANSVDGTHWLKTQNRADGGKYYYATYTYYFNKDYRSYGYSTAEYTRLYQFQLGAAYRYDFGYWSLRPRVGIGLGGYQMDPSSYLTITRDAAETTEWHMTWVVPYSTPGYIYGGMDSAKYGNYDNFPVLVGTAGLQLTYSVGHHFFFSLEAGLKVSPNRIHFVRDTYQAKDAYDPQNWAEAVFDYSSKGYLVCDESSMTSEQFTRCAAIALNLSAGIGWNIGWNRYDCGKYRR